MLYDTDRPPLLARLAPDEFQSTLDRNVRFLRPMQPGRLVGTGRTSIVMATSL
jgi:acyl-coenzyme A thioesterase PaaI-like protein